MSNLVTPIQSFVYAFILAQSSSASKPDKLPSPSIPSFLQEFFSNNPVFAWVFWLFTREEQLNYESVIWCRTGRGESQYL